MASVAQIEVGSVVSLWRYPVKSMMGEELNATEVTQGGLVGDSPLPQSWRRTSGATGSLMARAYVPASPSANGSRPPLKCAQSSRFASVTARVIVSPVSRLRALASLPPGL